MGEKVEVEQYEENTQCGKTINHHPHVAAHIPLVCVQSRPQDKIPRMYQNRSELGKKKRDEITQHQKQIIFNTRRAASKTWGKFFSFDS